MVLREDDYPEEMRNTLNGIVRLIRCKIGFCRVKVAVSLSAIQFECFGDAMEAGIRGDGWALYHELQEELDVICPQHEKLLVV